jgi:hypothetical protein
MKRFRDLRGGTQDYIVGSCSLPVHVKAGALPARMEQLFPDKQRSQPFTLPCPVFAGRHKITELMAVSETSPSQLGRPRSDHWRMCLTLSDRSRISCSNCVIRPITNCHS